MVEPKRGSVGGTCCLDDGGVPSPLAAEGGFSRSEKPGEGSCSAISFVEADPSPNRVCCTRRHALSRKGRGRINARLARCCCCGIAVSHAGSGRAKRRSEERRVGKEC